MKLSTTGKIASPLDNEHRLSTIDHAANAKSSDAPAQRNTPRVLDIKKAKHKMNKLAYDQMSFFKLIHVRKIEIFCRTATTQVGCVSNDLSIISNGLLDWQSFVDGAI